MITTEEAKSHGDITGPGSIKRKLSSTGRQIVSIVLAVLLAASGALIMAPAASAATNRCPAFVTWEDWIGGARVHAYVDFRASDICNGRHVKKAYIRIMRSCGPGVDTGRKYTATARADTDSQLYSVSEVVFDSVVWRCNTNTYYGYEYF